VNGGSSASDPHHLTSTRYHGSMNAPVGDRRSDFSRPQYQLRDEALRFENGEGIGSRSTPME